jgi:hypothetical protein
VQPNKCGPKSSRFKQGGVKARWSKAFAKSFSGQRKHEKFKERCDDSGLAV